MIDWGCSEWSGKNSRPHLRADLSAFCARQRKRTKLRNQTPLTHGILEEKPVNSRTRSKADTAKNVFNLSNQDNPRSEGNAQTRCFASKDAASAVDLTCQRIAPTTRAIYDGKVRALEDAASLACAGILLRKVVLKKRNSELVRT